MKIARCVTCRKKVSVSASACPKCGGTYFKKKNRVGVFVLLAVIVVIAIAVASSGNTPPGESEAMPEQDPWLQTSAGMVYNAIAVATREQVYEIVDFLVPLGLGDIVSARDTFADHEDAVYHRLVVYDEAIREHNLANSLTGDMNSVIVLINRATMQVVDVSFRWEDVYLDGEIVNLIPDLMQ